MGKERVNQVQEAQRVPYRINPKRNMPRHILIKLSKIKYKQQIFKAVREDQETSISLLDSLIHHRADSRSKKNYNPAACGIKITFTER